MKRVVHVLREGGALCGTLQPSGHLWISFQAPDALDKATCKGCKRELLAHKATVDAMAARDREEPA